MPSPYNQIEKQNVYKNCATLKTKKRRKQKIIFSPQFFLSLSRAVPLYFLVALFSPPSFHKFFVFLIKKRTNFLFSKQHFQIEKKIYKLISTTTQQNQFRGISTKMMEKEKQKERNLKTKIHHQQIAKNICTRKKVKCIKKITTITTTTKSIKKFSCTHNTSTFFSFFLTPLPPS